MTRDVATAFAANRPESPIDDRPEKAGDVPSRVGLPASLMIAFGVVVAIWVLLLPPGGRTLPALLLSVWGMLATWALPMEDTVPVVLLCLSVSTAELPGMPLEEMGPFVVVFFWIARSLLSVLLRRDRKRGVPNASVSVIVAILALLACNLVVMGYRSVAAIAWLKNAFPWLLCLVVYPVSKIQWTPARFDHTVDMMVFTGAMVSVADILQFVREGGVAGAAELGGEAFVSMLPLLAIVAILLGWERLRGTSHSATRRLYLLATFTVCVIRSAMSLQRAWLIAAVVGLIIWIWSDRSRRSRWLRRLVSAGTLMLVFVIGLLLVSPASQLFQNAYTGFVARIGRSWVGGSFDNSIGTRLVEVTAAMQSLRDSPVFGTGLGSFIEYFRPNGAFYSVDYIHIGPIFVLTKLGIVGLAVFGWLVVHVATMFRRVRGQADCLSPYIRRFLSAELLVVSTLFLMTRYVFKPSNAALVWLLVGMALSLQNGLPGRNMSGTATSRDR